jgi:cytochrome c biogenesis protein CcmG/thiol:disulfide interchange protein DsbE
MSDASTVEPTGRRTTSSGRRRPAPWVALAVAVVIGALFVVLAGAKADTSDPTSGYLVGKPAPAVKTTTIDGQSFDLSRRKGSWVVLNFFASNCPPCLQEHPELVKFAEQQRQPGAVSAELYTVINVDTDANVRKWFADNGGDWTILHDDDGSIAVSFGLAKVPETWIVDPNGTIVARWGRQTTAAELTDVLNRYATLGS